jgi:hypothetical protein
MRYVGNQSITSIDPLGTQYRIPVPISPVPDYGPKPPIGYSPKPINPYVPIEISPGTMGRPVTPVLKPDGSVENLNPDIDNFDRLHPGSIPSNHYPKPNNPVIVSNPCDGYNDSLGTSCLDCNGNKVSDPYPEKAKSICLKFLEQYKHIHPIEVECVARCLAGNEKAMAQEPDCDKRHAQRLMNHINCYCQCFFLPDNGLPEGGLEVGAVMLLPSWFRNSFLKKNR